MDKEEKLQWSALEYEERERGRDWFWALGVIVVATAITSIIYGNYFFAVLVMLGGALLAMFSIKRPDTIFYELNDKGLQIGTHLYPYENISAFWIQEGVRPTLFIKSERFFLPIISMPIDESFSPRIRQIFIFKEIVEEEMKESTAEKVIDSFGF